MSLRHPSRIGSFRRHQGKTAKILCFITFFLDFPVRFSLSNYFHDKRYYDYIQLLFLFWLGLPAEFFFH